MTLLTGRETNRQTNARPKHNLPGECYIKNIRRAQNSIKSDPVQIRYPDPDPNSDDFQKLMGDISVQRHISSKIFVKIRSFFSRDF